MDYAKAFPGKDGLYHEDCVIEIASLTKLVTVIAALQLVESGRVTLDEDISYAIPSYAKQPVLDGFDEAGKPITHTRRNPITLRLLLTHSAGAGYLYFDTRLERYKSSTNTSSGIDGTVDGNFDFPLSYEPNEGFLYSSSMDRVGQVVERVAGMSLEDYFRDNIWHPLGITSASFWRKDQPPMAVRPAPNKPVISMPEMETFTTGWKECSGGQGLVMSMKDYIKILHSLLSDDEKLLKRETAANIFRPCLSPANKRVLLERVKNPNWLVGEFPDTNEYDWSFGGMLIDGDQHRYRNRNTVIWSGASSCYWVSCKNFESRVMRTVINIRSSSIALLEFVACLVPKSYLQQTPRYGH